MVTDKEHRRDMRRISKIIKAADAQIRKNEVQGKRVPQKSTSKKIKGKPPTAN
jgi:fructose-specific phosphotransferase system component IIB